MRRMTTVALMGSVELFQTGFTGSEEIVFTRFNYDSHNVCPITFQIFIERFPYSKRFLWALSQVVMWNKFHGFVKHSICQTGFVELIDNVHLVKLNPLSGQLPGNLQFNCMTRLEKREHWYHTFTYYWFIQKLWHQKFKRLVKTPGLWMHLWGT